MEKRLIEAAEQGDAVSQCNLGILYANGLDDNGYPVKGNRPQAVRWLLAAAKQGLPRAQISRFSKPSPLPRGCAVGADELM